MAEQPPAEDPMVLVVDDESVISRFIATILTCHGYRVLQAHNVIHALQFCNHHSEPIHLLLTDVLMPGMNGRELAALALAVRPQMRVLYISGYEEGLLMQGLGLGEEIAFLQKPFSAGALLQKVRDVLGTMG